MYELTPDPYCYPGTTVLKNRLGITDQPALNAFEAMITAQRADEPLPRGRLGYAHYRAIHRHLFQDVFEGRVRRARADPHPALRATFSRKREKGFAPSPACGRGLR
jgi:cell filamentation protein